MASIKQSTSNPSPVYRSENIVPLSRTKADCPMSLKGKRNSARVFLTGRASSIALRSSSNLIAVGCVNFIDYGNYRLAACAQFGEKIICNREMISEYGR